MGNLYLASSTNNFAMMTFYTRENFNLGPHLVNINKISYSRNIYNLLLCRSICVYKTKIFNDASIT